MLFPNQPHSYVTPPCCCVSCFSEKTASPFVDSEVGVVSSDLSSRRHHSLSPGDQRPSLWQQANKGQSLPRGGQPPAHSGGQEGQTESHRGGHTISGGVSVGPRSRLHQYPSVAWLPSGRFPPSHPGLRHPHQPPRTPGHRGGQQGRGWTRGELPHPPFVPPSVPLSLSLSLSLKHKKKDQTPYYSPWFLARI